MDAKKRVVRRRRRRLIVPKALSASMKKENPTRARHSHSSHSPAENSPQFNATPSHPNARVISRPIPKSRRRPLLDCECDFSPFPTPNGKTSSRSRARDIQIARARRKVSDARHKRRVHNQNAKAKKGSRSKETTSRTVSEHLSGRHRCLCACVVVLRNEENVMSRLQNKGSSLLSQIF